VTNLPSFAKRDLANLPLQLLDAVRSSESACSARAAAKLSVWAAAARATDEPAHSDAASNRESRTRSVSAGSEGTDGSDSRLAAGGGQDGSSAAEAAATILMHFSFPVALRKLRTLRNAWAGLLWRLFSAKLPSAGEG
jgi:hypothetical protein